MARTAEQSVEDGVEPDIGDPKEFGRQLRLLRISHGAAQEDWAKAIERPNSSSMLSRLERGEQRPPERVELILWGRTWGLNPQELDELLVAAGYLPDFGVRFSRENRQVLVGALRALKTESEEAGLASGGFISMLRGLLRREQPVYPAARALAGNRISGVADKRLTRTGGKRQ